MLPFDKIWTRFLKVVECSGWMDEIEANEVVQRNPQSTITRTCARGSWIWVVQTKDWQCVHTSWWWRERRTRKGKISFPRSSKCSSSLWVLIVSISDCLKEAIVNIVVHVKCNQCSEADESRRQHEFTAISPCQCRLRVNVLWTSYILYWHV